MGSKLRCDAFMVMPRLTMVPGLFAAFLAFAQEPKPLTNQRLIDLASAGVSQTELIRLVSTAPRFSFDLSGAAEQAMTNAGISAEVVKAMEARSKATTQQKPPTFSVSPASAIASAADEAPTHPEPPSTTRAAFATSEPSGTETPSSVVPARAPSRRVGAEPHLKRNFVLYQGTPVRIRIMQTVSSADAQVGNNVNFKTLDDIRQNGIVVIPKGSTAIATITVAEAKKRMARGGKLGMNIDYVRLSNGDELPLRGIQNVKGGGHAGAMTGAMVATAIVFWPASPLFLFMHGKDVVIPEGHEVTVFTNTDYEFSPDQFAAIAPN